MKNKKILKKMVATAALLGMTLIPTIAWASSYTSTLSFDTNLRGATRYYDGNNITLSATSHASSYSHVVTTYSVTLYRKGRFTSDRIGSANYWRDGYDSNTWSNVGSGNYYFSFEKATDGIWITSDDVKMHN